MNIIIFDFNKSIGGAETFNARFIRFLVDNGDDVAVVGIEGTALFELLEKKGIVVKKFITPGGNDFFVSPIDELSLVDFGQKIIDSFAGQNIYVLASYFDVLHKAMHIFNGDKRVRITTGILHPESWSVWEPNVGFNSSRAFKPKKINSLWHYQRQLLRKLDGGHAIWYPNDIYRKYNADYFSVPLLNQSSATVPIESTLQRISYEIPTPKKTLKVVWLGRFDFFKNESILCFIENLNLLLEEESEINICFDLIGYGVDVYEKEVETYISLAHERLAIRILGWMNETEIHTKVEYEQYDFGVAMGSSAYHLAMIGLPVIALDSCVKGYRRLVKAIWLDEASDEFDEGSSLYLTLIGEEMHPRQGIKTLLLDVFRPGFLSDKAKRCSDYVDKWHNIDIILPKIRGFLLGSDFSEKFTYKFMRNLVDEFYHCVGDKKNISVAIFGAGSGARAVYGKICADIMSSDIEIKVKCFFDNDEDKIGTALFDIPVEKFSLNIASEVDVVIIASDYWPEIKMQMMSCGVSSSKIVRAY